MKQNYRGDPKTIADSSKTYSQRHYHTNVSNFKRGSALTNAGMNTSGQSKIRNPSTMRKGNGFQVDGGLRADEHDFKKK